MQNTIYIVWSLCDMCQYGVGGGGSITYIKIVWELKRNLLYLSLGQQEVESAWTIIKILTMYGLLLVKRSHSVMIRYILNMHRLGYSIPCICCLWILICSWQLSLCGWTPYWQGSSSQRQCVDRSDVEAVCPPHLTHIFGTCKIFL